MKTTSFSPTGQPSACSVTLVVDHRARATLWLHGEHDLATVGALADAVASALADSVGDVLLDLSDVQFMDASIIGSLVRARARCLLQGRALVLRSPSGSARRLLDICAVGYEPGTQPSPSAAASGASVSGAVPRVRPASSPVGSVDAVRIQSPVTAVSSAR